MATETQNSPDQSESIYRPLNASKREIRVLWLLPPPTPNKPSKRPKKDRFAARKEEEKDPIQVELTTVSLLDQPAYTAISYCWGSPDANRYRIFVNGQPLEVRVNLYDCLVWLRRKGIGTKKTTACPTPDSSDSEMHVRRMQGIPLWIDMICINQENLAERNSQVLLMGDLFRNATAVVSWIWGDERYDKTGKSVLADCVRGLRLVGEIGRQWMQGLPADVEAGKKDQEARTARDDASDFKALAKVTECLRRVGESTGQIWEVKTIFKWLSTLFNSQYWRRTWIVQERILAGPGSHFFMCGEVIISKMEFNAFGECLRDLLRADIHAWQVWEELRRCPVPGISESLWLSLRISARNELIFSGFLDELQCGRIAPGWWFALLVGSRCWCTDPRDAVYGLLQLIPNNQSIIPDYTRPVRDVYIDWALAAISERCDLQLLLYAGTGRAERWPPVFPGTTKTDLGLPSWVPDLFNYKEELAVTDWSSCLLSEARDVGSHITNFSVRVTPKGGLLAHARRRATVLKIVQLGDFMKHNPTRWNQRFVEFCDDYIQLWKNNRFPAGGIPPLQCLARLLLRQRISRMDPHEANPATGKLIHHLAFGFVAWLVYTKCDLQLATLSGCCQRLGLWLKRRLARIIGSIVFNPMDYPFIAVSANWGLHWGNQFTSTYRTVLFPQADIKHLMGWTRLHHAITDARSTLDIILGELDRWTRNEARLFMTEEGHVGTGPHTMQPGDFVYEVEHCPQPLVFRSHNASEVEALGSKTVTLMGSCEVVGIGDDIDSSRPLGYDEEIIIY